MPNDAAFYTVFPTAIGPCAVAWTARGLIGVQLPDGDAESTGARIARRRSATPAEPTAEIQRVIDGIAALLAGERADLAFASLDLGDAPPLHARIWAATRAIPPGETRTYGEIAASIGLPHGAQAVGVAMARNRIPLVIPCHRVLAAGGRLGGFSAPGGVDTKRRLLAIEGAVVEEQPSLFD